MIKRTSITQIVRKNYFSQLFILNHNKANEIIKDAKESFQTKGTKQFLSKFLNLYRFLRKEDKDKQFEGITKTQIEEGTNIEINFDKIPKEFCLVHAAKQLWKNPVDTGNQEIRFLIEVFFNDDEQWREKTASRVLIKQEDTLVEDRLAEISL